MRQLQTSYSIKSLPFTRWLLQFKDKNIQTEYNKSVSNFKLSLEWPVFIGLSAYLATWFYYDTFLRRNELIVLKVAQMLLMLIGMRFKNRIPHLFDITVLINLVLILTIADEIYVPQLIKLKAIKKGQFSLIGYN